jgi:cytochrome c peroxidase
MIASGGPAWTPADTRVLHSLRLRPPEIADPLEEARAMLGQRLFWEKRLSGSGNRSCATCHNPRLGWSDGRPLPRGGGLRHTPTLWHVASNAWFFWDGRTDSLAAQALHPIESLVELRGHRQSVARLVASDDVLRLAYEQAFGRVPPLTDAAHSYEADVDLVFANVGRALAAFQQRIVSTNSPFDRYVEAVGRNAAPPVDFAASAQRGLRLFLGRANCIRCHNGPAFSDGTFHNTGLASAQDEDMIGTLLRPASTRPSPAILALTRHSPDELELLARGRRARGEFKTPTLRNIAETAPYMHDGRFSTLREVLAYYSTLEAASFEAFRVTAPIQPQHLSQPEADDVIEFLKALTGTLAEPRWAMPPPFGRRSSGIDSRESGASDSAGARSNVEPGETH